MTPDTTEPLYTRDIDPGPITSRRVALVGYGNHGRSHALCLRDSGVSQIRIALRAGSASRAKAEADGFEVVTVAEAAAWADVIALLAADEAHRQIWTQDILPHRKPGQALIVCHGFSVHYGMIEAPADADIILAAAKGPGGAVRQEFLKGRGLIGFWAVHQDASGQARALALAYLAAIGSGNVGIFPTTFREETVSDLFGEQVVLVGGMVALAKASFTRLTAAGVSERMAYIDCVHELKYLADLIQERGIAGMYEAISDTAEFGAREIEDAIAGPELLTVFDGAMEAIESGSFARKWVERYESGDRLQAERARDRALPIEAAGAELRSRLGTATK
ncbi:ketol-acid reductoisomerase [Maricaulis salignorans]|uniref:Ketol-acid reductoisomerase n=1 Tax=Maricaulis salignorans TaxID=144026 RepID=A0A1G9SB21_9PROT|nr:ketol-acid reductoisomerase [Maricaulis salignorans]SDM32571.1 ketol-acid reductoisomerase [Maricaulis salignorans]